MRTVAFSGALAVSGRSKSTAMAVHPPRVLVVDDEEDIRETVADILEAEGYAVETARNGLEAWRRVAREPVDLVLVDLMMPIMDGRELHSKIRDDPKLADTPIVAVSAIRESADGDRFDAFLPKPFDLDDLLSTVEHLCRLH